MLNLINSFPCIHSSDTHTKDMTPLNDDLSNKGEFRSNKGNSRSNQTTLPKAPVDEPWETRGCSGVGGWVGLSCVAVSVVFVVCLSRVRAWSERRVRAPRVLALRSCAPRHAWVHTCVVWRAWERSGRRALPLLQVIYSTGRGHSREARECWVHIYARKACVSLIGNDQWGIFASTRFSYPTQTRHQ